MTHLTRDPKNKKVVNILTNEYPKEDEKGKKEIQFPKLPGAHPRPPAGDIRPNSRSSGRVSPRNSKSRESVRSDDSEMADRVSTADSSRSESRAHTRREINSGDGTRKQTPPDLREELSKYKVTEDMNEFEVKKWNQNKR